MALLLACSDSRVVPTLLLGTGPGDLFEVRVGNIVAPAGPEGASVGDSAGPAAVEYSLLALDVHHLVVLGHSGCGAMKAVAGGHVPAGAAHLARWLVHARGALARLERAPWIDPALPREDRLSQANVVQQLGYVAEQGRQVGVKTPLNDRIAELVNAPPAAPAPRKPTT